MSEATKVIDYEALSKIPFGMRICMARLTLGYIEKRGKNDFHKYKYAKADDILGMCGKALCEHGVLVCKNEDSEKLEWSVRKTAKGGDEIVCKLTGVWYLQDAFSDASYSYPVYGEGADVSDKAYYKADTGAYKYFLRDALCLALGDDPEASGDEERESGPPSTTEQQKPESNANRLTTDQVDELMKLALESNSPVERILAYFKVSEMALIPYGEAKTMMEKKIAAAKKTADAAAVPQP